MNTLIPILKHALLTAGLTLAAAAAVAEPTQEQSARQIAVASSKYAAIQELRDRLAQDLSDQYPEKGRTSVYIDLALPNYILQTIKLNVDQNTSITRNYSEAQATALTKRGADRLYRFNAKPGKHSLAIEYEGYLKRPSGKKLAVSDTLSLDIETKSGSQAFILPVVPKILRPVRTLSQKGSRDKWNWKSEAADPRLDLVRYLRDTDNSYEALLELLRVAGPSDNTDTPPRGFHTLLAQVYADFGMRIQAMRAAIKARANDDNPEALADVWLAIAELDYQREHFDDAETVLTFLPRDALQAKQLAVADLKSRILLAQEKYAEAATTLRSAIDSHNNDKKDNRRLSYLRYNYAVALIKSGRRTQGRAELDRLGQNESGETTLRDRANLVLGYHLLNEARGTDATPVFQRLPLSGPYTNRGLLGLGWSELSHSSESDSVSSKNSRARRALDAWRPLTRRNPMDPAVQEALVAAPYASEQLGQFDAASRNYKTAIESYERVDGQLKQEAKTLRRGDLSDAILKDNAGAIPHSGTMEDLYTSHRFQTHAQNYRDLERLQQALADLGGSPKLQRELAQTADEQIQFAQNELAEVLETQIKNLEQYEISARLGLLRNYNRDEASPILRATPENEVQ